MKKLLLVILMVMAFIWGLFECREAQADHWARTGVFDPGYYMACAVLEGVPLECFLTIANGSEKEAQANVDALNDDTTEVPGWEIVWYHWANGYWIKYKVPWKFVKGVVM